MCEFCSFGPNSQNHDRDSDNPIFSCFFCPDAIDAVIRQSTKEKEQKRRQRKAQKYIRDLENNDCDELCLLDTSSSVQFDDEDEIIDEDDDGT